MYIRIFLLLFLNIYNISIIYIFLYILSHLLSEQHFNSYILYKYTGCVKTITPNPVTYVPTPFPKLGFDINQNFDRYFFRFTKYVSVIQKNRMWFWNGPQYISQQVKKMHILEFVKCYFILIHHTWLFECKKITAMFDTVCEFLKNLRILLYLFVLSAHLITKLKLKVYLDI